MQPPRKLKPSPPAFPPWCYVRWKSVPVYGWIGIASGVMLFGCCGLVALLSVLFPSPPDPPHDARTTPAALVGEWKRDRQGTAAKYTGKRLLIRGNVVRVDGRTAGLVTWRSTEGVYCHF